MLRFSELARRVHSEGRQHVTVHGRKEVVTISSKKFRRLKGDLTGEALIAAMQASPDRPAEIEPTRAPLSVRDIILWRVGCWIPTFYPNCADRNPSLKSSPSQPPNHWIGFI